MLTMPSIAMLSMNTQQEWVKVQGDIEALDIDIDVF
jgi:uncharacterized pyridoxamine 5'-phosphate oxidase family protein